MVVVEEGWRWGFQDECIVNNLFIYYNKNKQQDGIMWEEIIVSYDREYQVVFNIRDHYFAQYSFRFLQTYCYHLSPFITIKKRLLLFQIRLFMQGKPEQIKVKTQSYQVLVYLQETRLLIELSVLASHPKLFILKLESESMPEDLELVFGDISILFQCFKSPFEVVLPQNQTQREAHIKVKAVYQFRNRTIEKEALLTLPQADVSVQDQLRRKIGSLEKQLKLLTEDRVQEFYHIGNNFLGVKKQETSKQDKKILQILGRLDKAKEQFDKVKQNFDEVYNKTVEAVKEAKESLKNTERLVFQTNSVLKKLQSKKQMVDQKEEKGSGDGKSCEDYPDIVESLQGPPSSINVDLSQPASHSHATSNNKASSLVVPIPPPEKNNSSIVEQIPQLRIIEKRSVNDCFRVKDNRITHLYESEGDQIILDHKMKVIPLKNKYIDRFKVKILRSTMNNIYIGVIPYDKRLLKKCNDVICYFGMDGELWDEKPLEQKVGKGFKEGDIVEVRLKTRRIKWKVNGVVEASYHTSKFGCEKTVYLPVIEILGDGDCVQWIP